MNAFQLYCRYTFLSVRSQWQYRASFFMQVFGNLLVTAGEIMGVWILFYHFGNLKGWQLPEIGMLYGIIHLSFALAEAVGKGFDKFHLLVKSGDFDRILLRPRGTTLQIAAQEFQLMRIGRFTQGLLVLIWASWSLNVDWTVVKGGLLLFAIIGGFCLFFGLLILQATMCFWTIESLEIMNILTYGGTEAAQFPMSIYNKWFFKFFTFFVPLACVNYFPVLAITEKGIIPWYTWVSPFMGFLFLAICFIAWNFGVRHYCSTGN